MAVLKPDILFVEPRAAIARIMAEHRYGTEYISYRCSDGKVIVVLGSLLDDYSVVFASVIGEEDYRRLVKEGVAMLEVYKVADGDRRLFSTIIEAAERLGLCRP